MCGTAAGGGERLHADAALDGSAAETVSFGCGAPALCWLRPSLRHAASVLAPRGADWTGSKFSILDVKIQDFACLGNSEGGVEICGGNESHAISHPPILSFAMQLASSVIALSQMLSEASVIALSLQIAVR